MEEIVAMGLMDLVKKAFLGASDEDNRKNRARVRDTFNSCVQMAIQFVPVMYKQSCNARQPLLNPTQKFKNLRAAYKIQ